MKQNDWQLLRFICLWFVRFFLVAPSFHGVFHIWEKIAKTPAINFLPLFHLHCYRQVTSIVTFILDYFVKMLLLKCLRSMETKKLHMRTVLPKLQSLILRVTRRDVQLEHCIVLNVPISSQNPKLIWITILLRSTAPQNLVSTSNVNFVFKSFQDFTL